MTLLRASDFNLLYLPSECERRVYLAEHATEAYPVGPFEELLFELGRRHEAAHLEALREAYGEVVDLHDAELEEVLEHLARADAAVLYQPPLRVETQLLGRPLTLEGRPDFLLGSGAGWVVRDAKLAKEPTAAQHPQSFQQVRLYGWMLERLTGEAPVALQIFSGGHELVPVPPLPEPELLAALAELVALKTSPAEPWTPVGWSKCSGCVFREHCLEPAWAAKDVALVQGIDQGAARALRAQGIETAGELLERLDEDELADLERPWGRKTARLGPSRAARALASARAIHEGRELRLTAPKLPAASRWVMFDLEGVPPYLEGPETVYLWGMQVFGEERGPYSYGLAGFGPEGDRQGWEAFLEEAGAILARHGDLPFVHWGSYENTKIGLYLRRYGDRGGVARRVQANLLDLLPVTREAVAVPLPSYSLKVIEEHVGFRRQLEGYKGDTSIARWIEATESQDEALRREIVAEVLLYNQEDLEATWAVLEWLRGEAAQRAR